MLEECHDSSSHINAESMSEGTEAPKSSLPPTNDDDAAAALLLARLQSQFGDMDLSGLAGGDVSGSNGENDNGAAREEQHDHQHEEDIMSEESSVVEPTPEEVQAWQEAQYKLGKWAEEAREEGMKAKADKAAETMSKRRLEKKEKLSLLAGSKPGDEKWKELFRQPTLGSQESIFFPIHAENGEKHAGSHPALTELAAKGDPEVLGGEWNLLYSSNSDGLSFHRLLDALRGYSGPTVMLIGAVPAEKHRLDSSLSGKKEMSPGTLGMFTTTPWEGESSDFFGNEDCFLFRILDELERQQNNEGKRVDIFRPITNKGNYMYCNPSSTYSSRAAGTNKALSGVIQYGLGAGGTSSRLRLHLTENFESCRALTLAEGTFAEGHLLPPEWSEDCFYFFDVDALEIWGVGGEEWIEAALLARDNERDRVEANLQKARKIDKKQLLDHFRSDACQGNHSNSYFSHLDQVQGRVDDCGMDRLDQH